MLEGDREGGLQQGCKHMTSTKWDEKPVKTSTGAPIKPSKKEIHTYRKHTMCSRIGRSPTAALLFSQFLMNKTSRFHCLQP